VKRRNSPAKTPHLIACPFCVSISIEFHPELECEHYVGPPEVPYNIPILVHYHLSIKQPRSHIGSRLASPASQKYFPSHRYIRYGRSKSTDRKRLYGNNVDNVMKPSHKVVVGMLVVEVTDTCKCRRSGPCNACQDPGSGDLDVSKALNPSEIRTCENKEKLAHLSRVRRYDGKREFRCDAPRKKKGMG
jgi:hypothetical protein